HRHSRPLGFRCSLLRTLKLRCRIGSTLSPSARTSRTSGWSCFGPFSESLCANRLPPHSSPAAHRAFWPNLSAWPWSRPHHRRLGTAQLARHVQSTLDERFLIYLMG